jgi:hypothetical protein
VESPKDSRLTREKVSQRKVNQGIYKAKLVTQQVGESSKKAHRGGLVQTYFDRREISIQELGDQYCDFTITVAVPTSGQLGRPEAKAKTSGEPQLLLHTGMRRLDFVVYMK